MFSPIHVWRPIRKNTCKHIWGQMSLKVHTHEIATSDSLLFFVRRKSLQHSERQGKMIAANHRIGSNIRCGRCKAHSVTTSPRALLYVFLLNKAAGSKLQCVFFAVPSYTANSKWLLKHMPRPFKHAVQQTDTQLYLDAQYA